MSDALHNLKVDAKDVNIQNADDGGTGTDLQFFAVCHTYKFDLTYKCAPGSIFLFSKMYDHIPELHRLCELALYELCTFAVVLSTVGQTLIAS
jgi:hypothetical protein